MNRPIIPIFYACDDNFVKYTIVSLHSMICNASKEYDYKIYVLNTNISEKMMDTLYALENDNFTVEFINVTPYLESIADKLPIRHYYTKTTYFRLFIADMFPQYDKAIYIDSDTIVQGDISKLYEIDLGENYVGACNEQAMAQVDVYGTYCEKVVGVSRENFFNAGMILINNRIWREKNVLDKFIEYLGIYNFIVTQDEDYLNAICKDNVLMLDQHWNTEITAGMKYDYDEAEAYILHYIMVNKPWHYTNCVCGDIFWKYASETSVYEELQAELAAYTDEQRERDKLSGENLYQMAIDETAREDTFVDRITNPEKYKSEV